MFCDARKSITLSWIVIAIAPSRGRFLGKVVIGEIDDAAIVFKPQFDRLRGDNVVLELFYFLLWQLLAMQFWLELLR